MIKKILRGFILPVILISALTACTVGVQRTEEREISGVSALSIATVGEFIVRQGEEESLVIEGPNNYLRNITTEVIDGTLYIDSRRGITSSSLQKTTYTLTVQDLDEISFSGAGSIAISSFETDDLVVTLTGAGNIEIYSLTANHLTVLLNSAGSIYIGGNTLTQDVLISGVGSYDASYLQSTTASVVLSGAGSAEVWVTDSLDVTITGVGSITYYGEPNVQQNVSGLGSINRKDDGK